MRVRTRSQPDTSGELLTGRCGSDAVRQLLDEIGVVSVRPVGDLPVTAGVHVRYEVLPDDSPSGATSNALPVFDSVLDVLPSGRRRFPPRAEV